MVDNGYSYGKNLLIAIDQLFSALIGYPCDETLSSVAHRLRIEKNITWVECVIDALFFWQEDHCKTAYESEQARKHFPPELRG